VRFDAPRRDQAVGTLLPGIEARVRTIDGIPLANGEVGELHVRGRNVMRGYYRAPELTAKVIDSEGWFKHRRSRAFRRRLPLYRRPDQGNDYQVGV